MQEKAILILGLFAMAGLAACETEFKSEVPDDPQCYTPCRRGVLVDDVYIPCPANGLMPMCVGGTECRKGSCVAPEEKVPKCNADIECPDFQKCIESRCYSDCTRDTDCASDEGCYRHVCKKTCTSSESTCPEDTYCSTLDGENGFCMPLAPSEDGSGGDDAEEDLEEIIGSFSLDKTSLRLSTVQNQRSVVISNWAPMAMDFTVRKVSHTEFTSDGVVIDTENPLYWLHMGQDADIAQVEEFTLLIDGNGGEGMITFGEATNDELPVWNGSIEVFNEDLGSQQIDIVYASRPDGQWSGKIYYFGNFGTQGLADWEADKTNSTLLEQVHNAFIQKWGAFRMGNITLDNFMAVLTSTRSESWNWGTMKPPNCPKAACYPFDNDLGYGEYSDNLDSNPVPTGMVELPVALNLLQGSTPTDLSGKISSADALHYAGDPAIGLTFELDPESCAPGVSSACLDFISSMSADIVVGGRYLPDPADTTCSIADYEMISVPWLVPGFVKGTDQDPETGQRYRKECRDKLKPYSDTDMQDANITFSGSNPLPDGRSRVRQVELVDGAMINQRQMIVIFRESFVDSFSFVDAADMDDFSAYGIMLLERNPTTLDDEAFVGSIQQEERTMPEDVLSKTCTDAIVRKALGLAYTSTWESDTDSLNALAKALVDGINTHTSAGGANPIDGTTGEEVHYLCHDTGMIDGGASGWGFECPLGSGVTFFTVDSTVVTQSDIDALDCQYSGTCQSVLDLWQADASYASYALRLNPFWRCTTPGAVYCENNRYDLRDGKTFYAADSPATVFVPLLSEVNSSFRYKTAFVNRSGVNVGFAPEVCVPDSNIIPYCYDPAAIQEVEERIDCVMYLYSEHRASLATDARSTLKDYLIVNYSIDPIEPGLQRDGFEALYAELLVMMGDESYTSAFASRFDLAGSMRASFEGSLFEPDGINLSGVAGHEMYSLYQAVQYYQMALDRFYTAMPSVWESIGSDAAVNYITQETVTNYFDRLIRASTQKSRAWSEVAKRYQSFNRPDLARLVVERAYTSTYLESVLITRMMHKVVNVVDPEDKAQILFIITQAQRQYKMALLDMRDVYKGISDDANFFGFSPDYIPFPALDDDDSNAFEKLIASAWNKTTFAAEKETIALENSRAYETDAASFQAELVSIESNYENQLAELCGTFEGPDGVIYPAISKYAYMDKEAQFFGDPCGFMGNGTIHEAMARMEIAALDLQAEMQRRDNKMRAIDIEMNRASEFCGETIETTKYMMEYLGEDMTLEAIMLGAEILIGTTQRAFDFAKSMSDYMKCEVGPGGTDCPTAAAAAAALTAVHVGSEVINIASQVKEYQAKIDSMNNEMDKARFELEQECDLAEIDSDAVVANLALELTEAELDILRAYYELQLVFDEIDALRNQAKRLEVEQQDMEQLAINIEAARNDPNVRIYKNDAIINADRAFNSAIREAYKATRVYEYYTSQTYEKLDQLFLIRMVAAGDYNLENYLMELGDAFYTFQEEFGNPDVRVAVISLRDDILGTPWLGANGMALSESDRLELFQQSLMDPELLDPNGYLTIPFSTNVETLSPLTRNHKILFIEAEVVGGDTGDTVGRVYLRQRGTGKIHSVTDEEIFYVFPERTAVINTFFNGERGIFATDDVFVNMRLRDRPYSNTLWELVLNQRDEEVNKDINLATLTDVRLYIYYTDFTEM
jgi:hypothetical protein